MQRIVLFHHENLTL